jgi:hypothetical protein
LTPFWPIFAAGAASLHALHNFTYVKFYVPS